MDIIPSALTAAVLIVPLGALALASAPLGSRSARAAGGVIQLAMATLIAVALLGLGSPGRSIYAAAIVLAGHEHALGLGIRLGPISLSMAAFIAAIGLVVQRYAGRALRDDARGRGFQALLALVVTAALIQALSPGLLQFALGWVAASIGLHRLLRHERGRRAAILAARTKFLISRLGDLAMVVAIATLLAGPGTTDFAELAQALAGETPPHPRLLLLASLALVVAVACKSALAPFQQWLIGTVEAPTPLSALLHAGVVNAGGFLVISLSPLFAVAPVALSALLVVGLASALLGPLVMWTQTDLKRSLAWSTVGQMGFMLVQCGLGAYGAAFLHLIGHGCYKAEAFLRSGTLGRAVENRPAPMTSVPALAQWVLGVVVAGVVLSLTYHFLGAGRLPPHGGLTVLAIQALALGQVVATPTAGVLFLPLRMLLLFPAGTLYALLTWGVESVLATSLTPAPPLIERGAAGALLAVAVPLAMAALAGFWVLLPSLSSHPWVGAWRVHLCNGLYLPHLTARLVGIARERHHP